MAKLRPGLGRLAEISPLKISRRIGRDTFRSRACSAAGSNGGPMRSAQRDRLGVTAGYPFVYLAGQVVHGLSDDHIHN
jgi:hypothetical protein